MDATRAPVVRIVHAGKAGSDAYVRMYGADVPLKSLRGKYTQF
jgi:hypothetical protein